MLTIPSRACLYCLAVLLLAACAAPSPIYDADFDTMQQRLSALQNWQVDGKIGLRADGRGSSALVSWQQQGQHYRLRLSGPLGIGTVLIEGDASGVEVRTKDGLFQADNPEQLLLEQTGWMIPVSELHYWARGLPAPGLAVADQQEQDGRLASLAQGGWQIDYRDFHEVSGLWLPAKMVMSRPETRLTLLYKRWRLEQSP